MLKKVIYGLKESPRALFDKFSKVIHVIGRQRSNVDHSVFVRQTTIGLVILKVYVDNVLLTGSDIRGIDKTKEYFVTTDRGNFWDRDCKE